MPTPNAPRARRRTLCLALLAGLAACSTGRYHPGALSPEQAARCREAERAYRAAADEYPALRDALARDPIAASWLTRMFVRDLFTVREGRPLGEDEDLLRAAARIEDPVEARAIGELVALGAAAVPALIGDLLRHDQPQPRELGIELLGRIGAAAVPALREVAESPEPRHRRAAARALGAIGGTAVLDELRGLAQDADYTVRADAVRGLRHGAAAAGALLAAILQNDADPFVRRVAAQALAGHREATAAGALIDYLERCQREVDAQGAQAAQASLQALAGARGPRTVAAWRAWAAALPGAARR